MQDRPTVQELLTAVRGFIEDEVVPALAGRSRFLALVSANVLAIVGRELEAEEGSLIAEWGRLARLLDVPGEPPHRLGVLRGAVRELTERLAARIRQGDADAGAWAEAVGAHVRETVTEKLRVASPRYLRS